MHEVEVPIEISQFNVASLGEPGAQGGAAVAELGEVLVIRLDDECGPMLGDEFLHTSEHAQFGTLDIDFHDVQRTVSKSSRKPVIEADHFDIEGTRATIARKAGVAGVFGIDDEAESACRIRGGE